MVSDGFGGQVADPFGRTTTISFVGRLSHERIGTRPAETVATGLDTALSLFLQWRFDQTVNNDEVILARGRLFRVGFPDPIKKFGGVYCYQAPLYPAGAAASWVTGVSLNGSDPVSFLTDDTFQLVATVSPATAVDASMSWSSDDADVVTVDSTGLVTAVGMGMASVTTTTHDGSFEASRIFEVTA